MAHMHPHTSTAYNHILDDSMREFSEVFALPGLPELAGACSGDMNAPQYYEHRLPGALIFTGSSVAELSEMLSEAFVPHVVAKGVIEGKVARFGHSVWAQARNTVTLCWIEDNPYNDYVTVNFHPDDREWLLSMITKLGEF